MTARYEDIRQKLAFALVRHQTLAVELQAARNDDEDIQFLGQKVGEILNACRECFDYCAKDLSGRYVSPSPKQVYFPFTEAALVGNAWKTLEHTRADLHAYLAELVKKIERNAAIERTLFGHKRVREVNELVNEKKHDKITRVKRPEHAATNVLFPQGVGMTISPIYPFDGEVPDFGAEVQAQPMIGSHSDIAIKFVSEYHLTENNWEVGRYCLHALETSWRKLDDLYLRFLSSGPDTLDPHETIKPPEQKKFEAALRRANPIVTRLAVVGLFNDDDEVLAVFVGFDGQPVSMEPDDIFVCQYFIDAYCAYAWAYIFKRELDPIIRDRLEDVEHQGYPTRVCEMHTNWPKHRQLRLPSGRTIRFNHVVWQLHTRFRVEEAEAARQLATPDAMSRATELFEIGPPRTVVGIQPIGG